MFFSPEPQKEPKHKKEPVARLQMKPLASAPKQPWRTHETTNRLYSSPKVGREKRQMFVQGATNAPKLLQGCRATLSNA